MSIRPKHFQWELDGPLATITLNRPERKNPLTFESYAELRDTFRDLAYAEDVQAVVRLGVAKINIAHGIRRVFLKTIRESLADGTNTDNPYLTLTEGRKAMKAYVSQKIFDCAY